MEDSFPIVREVIFSTEQALEQQESVNKSIHAIFIEEEFLVKVTFDSPTRMILGITPPNDWTHSDANADALINQALSSMWTILSPAVRVVTFAIALSKEEQEELQRALIAFSKEKQFSVLQVTFDTGTEMTVHVKPLREGLNVDSFIIQALTAAQHPLERGIDLLPKDQTWTLSAADLNLEDNLDTVRDNVLGEGEVAKVSNTSSNLFGWGMSPACSIDSLVTFPGRLGEGAQETLRACLRYFFRVEEDLSLTVTFISPTQMALRIESPKDLIKQKVDVVILIKKALTDARNDRRLSEREEGTRVRPLRVVVAKFSCPYDRKSSIQMIKFLRPLVEERNLSIDFAAWPHKSDQLTLYITPLKDQPCFLLDVDTTIIDAIRVSISQSPWTYITVRLVESDDDDSWTRF